MTSYPSPLSPSPALIDETMLQSAIDCLLEHVPLEMTGDYCPQDLFERECQD
ncbi:hypothetical protein IFO70_31635 [Phormidium tenue FACHB-886]|nr:hypothetical protein [Phormidium tenue FACHB-886]